MRFTMVLLRQLILLLSCLTVNSFVRVSSPYRVTASKLFMTDEKFDFGQRIESVKSLGVGAVSGSLAAAPFIAFRDLVASEALTPVYTDTLAQFEYDCDMAAVQAGLFAIVYRYCIRQDENDQLKDGIIGAFALTRALSRVVVPATCSAVPLTCGPPLGIFDWTLLAQIGVNLAEAAALFGTVAAAMNYCFYRRIISKFP